MNDIDDDRAKSRARVERYLAARAGGPELDELNARYAAREARRSARVSAEIRAIVRHANKQRSKRK